MTVAPGIYTDEWTGYIVTYSGKVIRPLQPDPGQIDIADIAHALSQLCRFTGHTRQFYSVAQHCVLVSEIVEEPLALTALLHDASEAYLSDIAGPVKQQAEFADFYRAAESRLEAAIAERFGIRYPFPRAIHVADSILLRTEQRDLMPNLLRAAGDVYLADPIVAWAPDGARKGFLSRFEQLYGGTT